MSSSMSTALIPYTPPKTAMEFIRSEVERGLKNGTIRPEQLALRPSLFELFDLNFGFITSGFSAQHMQERSWSNRRIDYHASSLASVHFPSFVRNSVTVDRVISSNSITEEELSSLIDQSQCKTATEFTKWLAKYKPHIEISYSTIFCAFWKLSQLKPPESVKAPETVIRLRPTKPVPPTEVIVAAGPGGYAWNRKLIEKMGASLQQDKTITSFTVLGDGEQNLPIDSVIDAIKTAKAKKLAISLFVQTHGEVVGQKHQLNFGSKSISSRVLFREIRRELGDEYPLFIFMTACYGGAAGEVAAKELPKGAIFVALSRGNSVVGGLDVEKFVNQMSSNPSWYNSEKMLYSYLAILQNRYVPSITYAPNRPLDLQQVLQSQLGKSLSELQTTEVCHSLSDWISVSEVSRLIEKIKRSSSTDDFSAVEWGKALAVSLSMSKVH